MPLHKERRSPSQKRRSAFFSLTFHSRNSNFKSKISENTPNTPPSGSSSSTTPNRPVSPLPNSQTVHGSAPSRSSTLEPENATVPTLTTSTSTGTFVVASSGHTENAEGLLRIIAPDYGPPPNPPPTKPLPPTPPQTNQTSLPRSSSPSPASRQPPSAEPAMEHVSVQQSVLKPDSPKKKEEKVGMHKRFTSLRVKTRSEAEEEAGSTIQSGEKPELQKGKSQDAGSGTHVKWTLGLEGRPKSIRKMENVQDELGKGLRSPRFERRRFDLGVQKSKIDDDDAKIEDGEDEDEGKDQDES